MLGWEVRAFASAPCRSVQPGRSLSVPGGGDSFGPVRDGISDGYCGGRSGVCGRELLVIAGLYGSDRGEAPHVEEAPQSLVTGRVMRVVHRLVVLAEELLVLSFGEIS